MKVSAVIPAFNRRDYLPRAIDSALAQTVPVDEIIVVDDGSTDGSADLVASRYGNRVRIVRQANSGVAGARRRGIQDAHGEWIAFLDSDDEWTPDRNRELLQAAERVPVDVAWIFGDFSFLTDDGESPSLFQEYGLTVTKCPQIISDPLSVQYPVLFSYLQASFIRRASLLELDCFTEGLRSDDDVLAGFQIGCRYKFAAIPHTVTKYYRTSDLASSSVIVNGSFSRDYYRSRMMAYGTAIKSGRQRPWNSLYASQVVGLCKLLDSRDPSPAKLGFEQFRYGGFSFKGIAFMCAAATGRRGVQIWNAVGVLLRRILRPRRAERGPVLGNRRYNEMLVEKYWNR
jgi:glycosyltransferase involved in cell wall biosynthesis